MRGETASQPSSLEGSLFGEVHLNEIKKLERLLEDTDRQKATLAQRLQETQVQLETAHSELELHTHKTLRLREQIAALLGHADTGSPDGSEFPEVTRLKAALEAKVSESGLEQELTRLKSQLQAYEAKTAFLEDDLRTTTAIAEDVFADASLAHDELVGVSEELAALYHHLCIGRPRPPTNLTLCSQRTGKRLLASCWSMRSRSRVCTRASDWNS